MGSERSKACVLCDTDRVLHQQWKPSSYKPVGLKGGGTISAHYQSFISIIQGEKFKNIGICHFLFFFYVWFWRVIFFFIHNKNKKLFLS